VRYKKSLPYIISALVCIAAFLAITVAIIIPSCAEESSKKLFSVKILENPIPAPSIDKTILVYELVISNEHSELPLRLRKIGIADIGRIDQTLAEYEGKTLVENSLIISSSLKDIKNLSEANKYVNKPDDVNSLLKKGMSWLVFVWIEIDRDRAVPRCLINHLIIEQESSNGDTIDVLTENYEVNVSDKKPVVLGDPVLGGNWVCAEGPGPFSYHRRAALPIDGTLHISQRYAVDFILLGDQGKFAYGDMTKNENYYCYGKKVHAVADGTIIAVKNDAEENAALGHPKDLSLEESEGNYIIEDIGRGDYAFYCHLRFESISVKAGYQVKRGKVIALLGNSGDSDAPHLSLRISRGSDPTRSEGQPFVFETFKLQGKAEGDADMTLGKWPWTPLAKPVTLNKVMPQQNSVVRFADYD